MESIWCQLFSLFVINIVILDSMEIEKNTKPAGSLRRQLLITPKMELL